ncbi:hypothetical protein D3C81_1459260 [compost metagenome]
MKTRQVLQHLLLQRLPLGVGEQQLPLPRGHHQYSFWQLPGCAQAIELPLKPLGIDATGSAGEQRRQGLFQVVGIPQHLQLAQALIAAALPAWRERVEYFAAPQGALGTLVTQHQAIAVHGLQRRIEQ